MVAAPTREKIRIWLHHTAMVSVGCANWEVGSVYLYVVVPGPSFSPLPLSPWGVFEF
jgi:hypothetical protein